MMENNSMHVSLPTKQDCLIQGWPHFLCGGQKNSLKKIGWHNNVSEKGWRAKVNLIKTHNRASLTLLKL